MKSLFLGIFRRLGILRVEDARAIVVNCRAVSTQAALKACLGKGIYLPVAQAF
jgi:hypothetical protein